MTAAALIAIWLVSLGAAVSPGPAVLMAARTGLREGFGRGAWLAAGIGLGACAWALAAMFGLALLFRVAPGALQALKLAGAAYLLWLGWRIWRDAPAPVEAAAADGRARGRAGLVWLGLSTQLANPKPAVFFGTVFLTFLPAHAPVWAWALVVALVFANEFLWNVIVARIFSLDRTRRGYLGAKTLIERAFAGLVAALGVRLAAG